MEVERRINWYIVRIVQCWTICWTVESFAGVKTMELFIGPLLSVLPERVGHREITLIKRSKINRNSTNSTGLILFGANLWRANTWQDKGWPWCIEGMNAVSGLRFNRKYRNPLKLMIFVTVNARVNSSFGQNRVKISSESTCPSLVDTNSSYLKEASFLYSTFCWPQSKHFTGASSKRLENSSWKIICGKCSDENVILSKAIGKVCYRHLIGQKWIKHQRRLDTALTGLHREDEKLPRNLFKLTHSHSSAVHRQRIVVAGAWAICSSTWMSKMRDYFNKNNTFHFTLSASRNLEGNNRKFPSWKMRKANEFPD